MGKIKRIYQNMPLKKALAITIIFSGLLALFLVLLATIATRPGYYRLTASGERDSALLWHNIMTASFIGIGICTSITAGIYFFYQLKLSAPLKALMNGTQQLAHENLDFSMQYEAEDELGALCRSFEKMRDELQLNNKRMWRMAEERKKINAAFAHDLRTPLTVLRGYTDFLEEYIPSPEKDDQKLLATNRMMAQYIKRLEDYVETMNTIQKLEDTPIKIQPISVSTFLELLNDNIKLTAGNYGKEFSVSNETDLTFIQGDIPLIFRCLENIIRNAFQYAKSKVLVRMFRHDNMLHFEVIDDGAGFCERDLTQALNPFYTTEPSDPSHFGLGICRTLCENHGGSISIGNTKELGARVELSFLIKGR